MKAKSIQVSYRDIAKMLVKAMPVEQDDFRDKVEEYIKAIKAMPQPAKVALKSAYIFSHKVPKDEREDFFQDIVLAVLKARTGDERLAYTIARCDWRDWWSKYKIRQHYSLDSVIEDGEGNQVSFGELLVGETEFEFKMDGELEAKRLWDKLPEAIQALVGKRLQGQSLKKLDRECLERWASKNAMLLVS